MRGKTKPNKIGKKPLINTNIPMNFPSLYFDH